MTSSTRKPGVYSLPIRRPVTTAMLFITVIVFGWQSYRQLSINLMPDITYPTLTVRTEYEGAAPEDVEKMLSRPLEETLSTVGGMVEISSISSPGLSQVILEFAWGTDMREAQQEVRDRLDLFVPPRDVTKKPVILRYDPTLDPVMRVAITGDEPGDPSDARQAAAYRDQLAEIRTAVEKYVKSDLEGEIGIAQAQVKGGREEIIQILLDPARLKARGLTPEAVVTALSQQNINRSGGQLRDGKTEYLVRTLNEYQKVTDIAKTILPVPGDAIVHLEDVADVRPALREQQTLVRINGKEAVEIAIYKWGDANTVKVCNKLKDLFGFPRKHSFGELLSKALKDAMIRAKERKAGIAAPLRHEAELAKTIKSHLPPYAKVHLISDQSAFIIAAVEEVKNTAVTGGLLALVILFFFLRNLRTTLIIGVSIPISIVATFLPMFLRDISLNIMSLGGIALGVGMLVDDSIIVLESIFRCMEEGDDIVDAADRGTREVFSADAASTFTTIAVFLPIAFVEGIAGQLFRDLALTVTFSLLASLAVALYLIPMLASRRIKPLEGDGSSPVWLMRAYRLAREEGHGRVKAALLVFPYYFVRFTLEWFQVTAKETFRSLFVKPAATPPTGFFPVLLRWLRRLFFPVRLLLLTALFLVQVLVKVIVIYFVTFLFFTTVGVGACFRLLAVVFKAVFWLPLNLFDQVFSAFRRGYAVLIRKALPYGPVILLVSLVVALHAGYVATKLGRELIPPLKQGEFGIRMEAPPGTRLAQTEQEALPIEQAALAMPEIRSVAMEIGQEEKHTTATNRKENVAQFTIRLADPKKNTPRQDEIIDRLRRKIVQLTPNTIAITLPSLFSFKSAVELQIRGDDTKTLRRLGEEVIRRIADVPGIKDLDLSIKEGYPEIIIRPDRERLARHGLTPEQIGNLIHTEVHGDDATKFNQKGNKIDIHVRTDRMKLKSLDDLRSLSVKEGYPPVPLESVADITVENGPSEIRRIDQREVVVVTANVENRPLDAVTRDIRARIASIPKPVDYEYVFGGQQRELQDSYKSLQFALLLALFLVYVVMACQFESIHQPTLVMFSVPLAFIGVVYTLYLLHINISIVVFIGGIVLAGIVVNDAIILVDYINQLRARGLDKREAVIQAAQVRLRPIIMTTLTTVLGLIPMAFQSGQGSEIRSPMAITVMAGLSSATLLTLVIIPVVYDLFGGKRPPKKDAP